MWWERVSAGSISNSEHEAEQTLKVEFQGGLKNLGARDSGSQMDFYSMVKIQKHPDGVQMAVSETDPQKRHAYICMATSAEKSSFVPDSQTWLGFNS